VILLIIRHGESEADLLDVHEGRADFPLTERGHLQAESMAVHVSNQFTVSKIYTSPLKRAAQTAQHLAGKVNCRISINDELMEFNNGLLAGLSRKVAAEKFPEIGDLPIDRAVYGQETKLDFRKRADIALETIIADAESNDVIAVITHGGMINQMYRSILKLPVDCNQFFGTGDTGIHVWKIENELTRIIKANMTEHAYGI